MIPPALQYKIGQLSNFSRERISIQPNGSTTVGAGQKIIIDLPYSTLVDLESLSLEFNGQTTGPANSAQTLTKLFFPRNIASLIETLEVKFNNQTVQQINNYGLIYNKLNDLTINQDAIVKMNALGTNADPSYRINAAVDDGVITYQRGYNVAQPNDDLATRIDSRKFAIRSFLGILGSGSTTCIDTGMVGLVSIHITLNNGSCLMYGAPGAGAFNVAPTFTLSDITCKLTRYQMNNQYYEAISSSLNSGSPYEIAFENYEFFQSSATTNFNTSVRFTTASKSLKYLMGGFLLANRDTVGQVIASNPQDTVSFSGSKQYLQVDNFNNSRYFYTSLKGVDKSFFKVGSTQLPSTPSDDLDRYTNACELFNIDNDFSTSHHPAIMAVEYFNNGFGVDILNLNYSRETGGVYMMSGLDTLDLPVSIVWNTTQKAGYTDATNLIPFVVAVSDKKVQIYAGQQIRVM